MTRSASGAPGGRWRLEQNRYSESLLSPSAAREARSVVTGKRERKADTCAAIRGSGGGGTVSRKNSYTRSGVMMPRFASPESGRQMRPLRLASLSAAPLLLHQTPQDALTGKGGGGCQLRAATKANGASWSLLVLDHCWDFKNSSFLLLCERQSIEVCLESADEWQKEEKKGH